MKKFISITFICLLFNCIHSSAQTDPQTIEEFKLKNGLEVKMIPFGTIPAATMTCFVNVGKKTENPGQQHLATLTASSLLLGNGKYSRVEQDNLISMLATGLNTTCNDNFTEINMRFLNKDAVAALDLFSGILLNPVFPAEDIRQEVEQILNYNNPYKMDISSIAAMYSDYTVFGTAHPLGRHFYATQLNKITSVQVSEFYKFNYTPKNTKILLVGNFDHAQMKVMIEKIFGNWNAAYGENNGAAYEVQGISKKEYFFINKSRTTQTCLRWNKKAPDAGSKDVLVFKLANDAFNNLLFDEIRAKEGKTYGINSRFNESDNNGIYSVSTQVRNEVAYETTVSFDRVLKQFYEKGVTQEQLDKAKETLKNSRKAIENPFDMIEFYNPILYKDIAKRNEYLKIIDAITIEQVNKAVKKYYTPDSYKLVMVGDQAILEPQLQKIKDLIKLPVTSIEKDN